MHIALLRFAKNKDQISTYMEAHNAWIKQGFDEGVFIMTGSIQPKQGGCVFAHNVSRDEFEERLKKRSFCCP